jgi:hypothetical protein
MPVGVVEMRIGFPVKQLNKSKDVLDESVKIVRDEMRDNLNSFMRARNFSRAPGKIGWNFFVCPLHVKACHLSLSLLLIGFSYYFWFVVFYFCVVQHVKELEQAMCHVRNERKNMLKSNGISAVSVLLRSQTPVNFRLA